MRDRLDEHACNLPWYQSSPGLPSCFISATHGLLKKNTRGEEILVPRYEKVEAY